MSSLHISLFGPFQVKVAGQPARGFLSDKVRALLAYLAVEPSRPYRREALAGLLWPEHPEKKARANLRRALANLRQVIQDGDGRYLHITRQTLQFKESNQTQIDCLCFAAQLADPDPTVSQLEEAASFVNGRFLEGFSINDSVAFEEWALLKREQYQQQILDCLNRLTRHYEQHKQYDDALRFAWQQVQLEPWHESGQRQLLRLLTYSGQRATAVAHFERFQQELRAELNITPETETVQLAEHIREGTFAQETDKHPPFLSSTQTILPGSFVAREREMQTLMDHLHTAVNGQSRVVFITGEAGSGKTRLLHAFAQAAQSEQTSIIPLFGNCQAQTGHSDPYLPFRAMLAQLVGNVEPLWQNGTLNRAQASRLWNIRDTAVQLLTTQAPDLIGTFVNRTQLPAAHNQWKTAVATPPQIVLFEQLTQLLQTISQQGPLLLLLDDLQWADNGSLDLLFHLGRQLVGYPIFILGTFRSEEVTKTGEQRHPVTRLLHEFTETLGDIEISLNQTAARPFVDAWLDSEPNRLGDAFRHTLCQQTKGQALFTVELVAEMQAQGELMRDQNGYWQTSDTVNWERLPARVEAVIAERIGRLPKNQRQLLNAAAIQGETFLAEVVAQINDVPLPEIISQFSRELSREHQLLSPSGRQRVGAGSVSAYRFRHNLFQTYLYGRLDEIERATLHERTGQVLEQLYAADETRNTAVAGQLAWHFEVGGQLEKAINYRQKAGNYALQLSANTEAVTHFKQALALLGTLPETAVRTQQEIDLQLTLGAALLSTKGYTDPEVKLVFDRARALCLQSKSQPQLVTALFWLSSYYSVRGDLQSGLNLAQQILDITSKSGVDSLYGVMAHVLIGLPLFFMGKLTQALTHFEQAIATYQPELHQEAVYTLGQDPGISSHIWTGHVLLHMGQFDQAEKYLATSLQLLDGLNHPHTAVFTLLLNGTPYSYYAPDYEKSHHYFQEALALATQEHFFFLQTLTNFYMIYCQIEIATAVDQSNLRESIEKMQSCLNIELQIGSQMGLTSRYLILADCYGRLGEIETGFMLLAKTETLENNNQERYFQAERHRIEGQLHLAQNNEAAAEHCFRQALVVAQAQGATLWELKATIELCQLWGKQGKQADAVSSLKKMIESFPEKSMLPDLQKAKELLTSRGSIDI